MDLEGSERTPIAGKGELAGGSAEDLHASLQMPALRTPKFSSLLSSTLSAACCRANSREGLALSAPEPPVQQRELRAQAQKWVQVQVALVLKELGLLGYLLDNMPQRASKVQIQVQVQVEVQVQTQMQLQAHTQVQEVEVQVQVTVSLGGDEEMLFQKNIAKERPRRGP